MLLPGSLRDTTLGDLLGRLHRQGVSGILELIEERSVTAGRRHRIHLHGGLITGVESDKPVPPIGEVLLSAGALSPVQHSRLVQRLRVRQAGLTGASLVHDGVVSAEAVHAALTDQLRMRLDALYSIEHASIRFHAGRIAKQQTLPVSEFLHGRPRARDERRGAGRARCGGPRSAAVQGMARAQAFAVLGLQEGASREQVRHAFRKLASSVHPDLHRGADPGQLRMMQQRFSRYSAAYHLLITQP